MPFELIIILIVVLGVSAIVTLCLFSEIVGNNGFPGFVIWAAIEIVLIGLIIGGFVWLTAANSNEELDWETFHSLVTDVQGGRDVQCIRIRHNSSIEFINMNAKFDHLIKEGSLVRRSTNKPWSCGIYSTKNPKYELIDSKHKRYAEAKEEVDKNTTTKPVN